MEQNKNHHYSGLTDAEVIASKQKNGVNVLTPPEKETLGEKVKNCMHYWLLKVVLILLATSLITIPILGACNVNLPVNVWSGPINHLKLLKVQRKERKL